MTTNTIPADRALPQFAAGPWEGLLNAFRAVGGVAENIRPAGGPAGGGLLPIDRTKQVVLRLPASLLYALEDIEFADGRVRIKAAAAVGRAERDFFESYANAFSWSRGRHEAADFIAALDSLPADVRELLIEGFGMGEFLQGDPEERIRRRYLHASMRNWNGQNILVPLVELATHRAAGLAYRADAQGGLGIEGAAQDEVLVDHGVPDSFGLFSTTGTAQLQPRAYSLPLSLKLDDRMLTVERNITARARRGDFQIPVVRSGNDAIFFSHLMIGSPKAFRLSRGIFFTLMREADVADANEAFDRILRFNRDRFLSLFAVLEPHEGPMITTLRQMARYQLETMAYCIGTREL